MRLFTLKIQGMKSVLCVSSVERAVLSIEGVDAVHVDLTTGIAKIRCYDETVTEDIIKNKIIEVGYSIDAQKTSAAAEPENQEANLHRKSFLLGVIAVIAALASLILYFRGLLGLNFNLIMTAATAECCCGLLALYLGKKIVLEGLNNLFSGRPCMESLTAVGVCFALLYSLFSLYDLSSGNDLAAENIYAAAAAAVLGWSMLGEYLSTKICQPKTEMETNILSAMLLSKGEKYPVTSDMLLEGDVIIVQKGEIIPADGIIEAGNAAVDESDFTGSSIPVLKDKGMKVMTGSYIFGGELTVKVCAAAVSLPKNVEVKKAVSAEKLENSDDKRAALFLPVILIVAVAVSLNWLFYSGSLGLAGKVFTAIMLVTCPCALKAAQSAALLKVLQKAAAMGIHCSGIKPLLLFKELSVVIFGKTGTITDRKIILTDIVAYNGVKEEAALVLAASLENSSLHPVAGALKDKVAEEKLLTCEKMQYHPGEGISAVCQQAKVCFGIAEYVHHSCRIPEAALQQAEKWREEGKTPLFLAAGRTLCAVLAVAEEIPQTSKNIIASLQAEGIRTMMMTGDTKEAALRAASFIGIEKYMGALSPQEKLELVSSISLGGEKVAVVSSCHNDCLEECKADLRIAVGCRQSINGKNNAADVVLQEGRLESLLQAIQLSKKLSAADRQGILLFYIFTVLLLPFAAGAFYFVMPGLLAQPVYILLAVLVEGLLLLANAYTI